MSAIVAGSGSGLGASAHVASGASGALEGLRTASGIPILGSSLAPFDEMVAQRVNFALGVKMIDPTTASRLWLRGELDDIRFIFYCKVAGYSENEIANIMQAAKPLVPPSDIISFVVKEAYTPELVKDLIGDELTPERFTKELGRWGYGKQDSVDYWTAHYDPLGKNEFEEMLHRLHPDQLAVELQRGEITADEVSELQFDEKFLDRMYRLKDVYPALRPRLRHISYKSPTRIDIRRFEDFGIIDDELLTYFNRALGYAPWVAELMTLYTKLSNALQDIKPFVQKGIWGEKEVNEALLKEGAPVETAVKLTARMMRFAKAEKAEKNRDLTLSYYQRAFKIDFRTRAELEPMILGLNYDTDETKFILDLWEAEKQLDTAEKVVSEKGLTKADIIKRYKLDKGSGRTAREKDLIAFGYDAEEAKFLLDIADAEMTPKPKALTVREKDLAKSDIIKKYKLELGANRAKRDAELIAIGYDANEVKFLLDNADIELRNKTKGASDGK